MLVSVAWAVTVAEVAVLLAVGERVTVELTVGDLAAALALAVGVTDQVGVGETVGTVLCQRIQRKWSSTSQR